MTALLLPEPSRLSGATGRRLESAAVLGVPNKNNS